MPWFAPVTLPSGFAFYSLPFAGANMMLKISELILRGPESKHTLHSAEAWAQKGLAVVQEARSKSWGTVPICEEMLVAAYHGAGLLREV